MDIKKRTIFLVILFSNCLLAVLGQSIAKLDSAKGFKAFKLGASKFSFTAYIKIQKKDSSNVPQNYRIALDGFPTLKTAFGSAISNFILHFDSRNQLQQISFQFPDFDNQDQDNAGLYDEYKYIVKAFGKPTRKVEANDVTKYQWIGKKVILTLRVVLVDYGDGALYEKDLFYERASDFSKIGIKDPSKDY